MISWSRAAMVPKLYQRYGASSGKFSLFLLSSSRAFSRVSGLISWCTYDSTLLVVWPGGKPAIAAAMLQGYC